MIIGCEHHSGMGLCSQCSEASSRSVAETTKRIVDAQRIREACNTLRRYGMFEEAARLERKAGG